MYASFGKLLQQGKWCDAEIRRKRQRTGQMYATAATHIAVHSALSTCLDSNADVLLSGFDSIV
jgi:hypothetical protein